jgi:autotransporter-associated beta strand protein
VPNPAVAYFYGAVSGAWNDLTNSTSSNWSLDANATQDAGNIPGLGTSSGTATDVIFSANTLSGSAVATTLGTNFIINSLNVNASPASTTIGNPGDTTTLQINALADSNTNSSGYAGNPAGNGISVAATAGPLTINVPVVLGNSQTWTNSSTGALTVTGTVQGTAVTGTTQTLTLSDSGGGTVIGAAIANGAGGGNLSIVVNNASSSVTQFAGANTYSGTTTVANGTLALGNTAALLNSTFNADGAGTLSFGTLSSATFGGLQGNSATLTLTNTNSSPIALAVGNNNSSTTFNGVLNDNSAGGSLTKIGTGTLTLGGNNSYTGATLISAGTLAVTGTGSLASSTSAVEVGTTPGSPAALVFGAGSVTNLTSSYPAGALTVAYGSTVTVPAGASLTTAGFVKLGSLANGSSGTFNQSGGTVSINGVDTGSGFRSLTIGEFSGQTSTYNLSGGSLSVQNASGVVYLPWNGVGVLNITGGSASFQRLSFGITTNTCTGTLDLTGGGLLNIGSGGIVQGQNDTNHIILDNGTVGSTAAWSSSLAMALTYTGGTNFDASGGNITLSSVFSGSGGMTKIGSGLLTLGTGAALASSFSGNVAVSGGSLEANGTANATNPTATPLGDTNLSTRTITVNNGGVLLFNQGNVLGGGASVIQTPLVINAGGLVADTTNAGNNVLGPVTLSGGTLSGINGGASGKFLTYQLTAGLVTVDTAPSLITVNGTTNPGINMGQTSVTTTTFNVGLTGTGGTVSANPDLTVAADLADVPGAVQFTGGAFSASLVKTGAGTMLLASSDSYSGTTTVDAGSLVLGVPLSMFMSTFDASGAGTLSFGALSNATFGGLESTGTLALTDSTGSFPVALSVGNNNTNTVFFGTLSDNGKGGSLTKIGAGMLTLNGSNTYTGGTTVSAGVLQLGNSAALGSGALAANGGTLDLGGYNVTVPSFSGAAGVVTTTIPSLGVAASLTVNQSNTTTFGGTITDGASPLALSLTGTGELTLTGMNTYTGGTTVADGELIVKSPTSIDANGVGTNLFVGNDLAAFGAITPAAGSGTPAGAGVTSVPEPGTLVLMLAAGLGVALAGRRSIFPRRGNPKRERG